MSDSPKYEPVTSLPFAQKSIKKVDEVQNAYSNEEYTYHKETNAANLFGPGP